MEDKAYKRSMIGASISSDTIIYCGTTYVMNKVTNSSYFNSFKISDLVAYFVSDGIFYMLHGGVADWFYTSHATLTTAFVAKYLITTGGVLISSAILGRPKETFLGTFINSTIAMGLQSGAGPLARKILDMIDEQKKNKV